MGLWKANTKLSIQLDFFFRFWDYPEDFFSSSDMIRNHASKNLGIVYKLSRGENQQGGDFIG